MPIPEIMHRGHAGVTPSLLSALALATAAALLSACAVQPTSQTPDSEQLPQNPSGPPDANGDSPPPPIAELSDRELYEQRQQIMAKIVNWNARGKIAYRLAKDAGSASLSWQQTGDRSKLRLSGPMGVGATEIRNEGALLRVSRDGIERLYPADGAPWLPGDQILPIPVDAIRYWLRGQKAPDLPVANASYDEGVLRSLHQNGWLIDYQSYKNVKGLEMPARLTLHAPGEVLSLRVILRDWDLM